MGKRTQCGSCGTFVAVGDACKHCHTNRRKCRMCSRVRPVKEYSRSGDATVTRTCKDCQRFIDQARGRNSGRVRAPKHNMHRGLLGAANKRGIVVTLTRSQYEKLRARPCHWCGGGLPSGGVGLDRLDNERGYEPGNVVPCCEECNIRRLNMPVERWARIVSDLRDKYGPGFWTDRGRRTRTCHRANGKTARIMRAKAIAAMFHALGRLHYGDVARRAAIKRLRAFRMEAGLSWKDIYPLYKKLTGRDYRRRKSNPRRKDQRGGRSEAPWKAILRTRIALRRSGFDPDTGGVADPA